MSHRGHLLGSRDLTLGLDLGSGLSLLVKGSGDGGLTYCRGSWMLIGVSGFSISGLGDATNSRGS